MRWNQRELSKVDWRQTTSLKQLVWHRMQYHQQESQKLKLKRNRKVSFRPTEHFSYKLFWNGEKLYNQIWIIAMKNSGHFILLLLILLKIVEETMKFQSTSQTRDLIYTKSQNKSLMNYSKEINDSKLAVKPSKK